MADEITHVPTVGNAMRVSSGSTRFRDPVRFQGKSGTYNWSTSASIQEHAEGPHHTKRTSQARPHRTYLVYRISGSGQDRCELRRVVDVENNTVRLGRLAHSPHLGEGYGDGLEGSLRDAGLRKPSVIDFGVTPATLIGLILPRPSCARDACREAWSFRGDLA